MFEIHEKMQRTWTLSFTKSDGTPGVVEGSPCGS